MQILVEVGVFRRRILVGAGCLMVRNMSACGRFVDATRGSSLIETAMVVPILVLMLCFGIDIGYFFIVAANLVSSSRNAVLYSGQGFISPAQQSLPSAGTLGSLSDTAGVAGLAGGDMAGLANMTTKTTVQVCSKVIGTTQTANGYVTKCRTYPSVSLGYPPTRIPNQRMECWRSVLMWFTP